MYTVGPRGTRKWSTWGTYGHKQGEKQANEEQGNSQLQGKRRTEWAETSWLGREQELPVCDGGRTV